jgi:hypothetical protein
MALLDSQPVGRSRGAGCQGSARPPESPTSREANMFPCVAGEPSVKAMSMRRGVATAVRLWLAVHEYHLPAF